MITLYRRTYPVEGAPVSVSLVPSAGHQRHTFTVGAEVYEADCRELRVVAPDDAKLDPLKNLLSWDGGKVKSTAAEVLDLAQKGASGFRLEE